MKKNQIYISVPVNAARNTLMELKKLCPNSEVFNSTKRYYSDDLIYLEKIKEGKMDEVPDILVTIRPEILWQRDYLKDLGVFDDEYKYGLDSSLKNTGILDDKWILKPIYIMPIVIFYNKEMQNPPQTWEDLLDEKYKGKIITTDEQTPPAELLKQFCKQKFGDKGVNFAQNNVEYVGLPIDVNKAVSNKEYDIGIMPLSFAMFSKDNSTAICWPKEGALHLTQVMLMKKGYSQETKIAADFLVSQKAQEMFSDGASFIPVKPDINTPKQYNDNNKTLLWDDWSTFIQMAK
nr:extracellular solute-binding protein [uncultured Sulfurimonas sp.]